MPKVLVVEDEPLVLMFVTEALEMAGFSLMQAHNGQAALELLSMTEDIDAVVTDVRMPKLSGFELVSSIRTLRPDLPVVFMSGFAGDNIPAELSEVPVLVKPFDPQLLVSTVRAILKR